MSAVFRQPDGERIEVSVSWVLAEQVADAAHWLGDPGNEDLVRGSVLDIGFNSRLGERVAVQGETIPREFLKTLAALDVELWLSIYPPFRSS